jgi:hypothetical protein
MQKLGQHDPDKGPDSPKKQDQSTQQVQNHHALLIGL